VFLVKEDTKGFEFFEREFVDSTIGGVDCDLGRFDSGVCGFTDENTISGLTNGKCVDIMSVPIADPFVNSKGTKRVTKTPTDSSPSFASAPVQNLLTTDLTKLSPEQLRDYVARLRTLRASPPTFTKALRDESDAEEAANPLPGKPAKAKKVAAPAKDLTLDYL